jgi:hypothetical protein
LPGTNLVVLVAATARVVPVMLVVEDAVTAEAF